MARNPRADARKIIGRKLADAVERLGIPVPVIARATGLDPVTLRGLDRAAPQIRTIEALSQYLQGVYRDRRVGKPESELGASQDC